MNSLMEALTFLMLKYYIKRSEPLTLNCGATSCDYFDLKAAQMNSEFMGLIAKITSTQLMEIKVDGIAAMESGGFPYLGGVLTAYNIQGMSLKGLMVRKKPKGHGTNTQVEGLSNFRQPYNENHTWVIEDVTTTGASALQVVQILRGLGFTVSGVISIIDRQEILHPGLEDTVRASFASKGLNFKQWPKGPFAQSIFKQHDLEFRPLLTKEQFCHINGI